VVILGTLDEFAADSLLEEAVKSEPVSPEAKSLQAEKTKREFP
jgi:hypothetical protein